MMAKHTVTVFLTIPLMQYRSWLRTRTFFHCVLKPLPPQGSYTAAILQILLDIVIEIVAEWFIFTLNIKNFEMIQERSH